MFSFIKTISKKILTVITVGFLFFTPLFADKGEYNEGIITSPLLNVRSGPGTEYPAIFQVKKNTRVIILEKYDAWIRISYEDNTGFVRNREKYIVVVSKKKSDAQKYYAGIVVSEWLNVRNKPDMSEKASFILKKDTQVYILENKGSWLKIKCNDQTGYIRNKDTYIKLISTPVIPETIKEDTGEKTVQIDTHENYPVEKTSEIYSEIQKHESDVIQFTQEERIIIKNLNQLDQSINKQNAEISKIKKNISQIQRRIDETTYETKHIQDMLIKNEPFIQKRLISIYKLQNIGNLQYIASADSLYDFFRQKKMMETILQKDAEFFETHINHINRLSELKDNYDQQQTDLLASKDNLKNKLNIISQEKNRRLKILNDIQNKKEFTLAAIESLRESAREIEKNILNNNNFSGKNAQNYQCPFRKKGMILPVNGKIISHFGKGLKNIFNFKTHQNGIDIQCERGDPVLAICSGQVIFSNWLQGYGNIIIIDHGDGFHTVYAYAEELFKKKDDLVELGEVIATVGETNADTETMLYFEIRHNGKPVDPLIWLKSF